MGQSGIGNLLAKTEKETFQVSKSFEMYQPCVHLLRWIVRCFCFAHSSGKIVIGYLAVMLVSDLYRMTDPGGFNIVRKFSSEFRGT